MKKILLIAGLIFLLILVCTTDFSPVHKHLISLGYGLLPLLFFCLSWYFVQTCSWFILSGQDKFLFLFMTKIVSDTLNSFIPLAGLGGESLRAFIISRRNGSTDGVSGIYADKTAEYIGGTLFMATGFLLAIVTASIPPLLSWILLIILLISAAGCYFLIQFSGQRLLRIIQKLPGMKKRSGTIEKKLNEMEKNLQKIFHKNKKMMLAAVGLQWLSRMLKAGEIWLLFLLFKIPMGYPDAYIMSAMITLVNTAFFMVPGQFGISEGAHYMVLKMLPGSTGLHDPAATGLMIGLIRRGRRLAFAVLTIPLLYLVYRKEKDVTDFNKNQASL